ncbi:MAG: hypothetical protein JWM20_410 [Patescibacteria group bacterium]|nr:hypothetical protein [Patescibacteria group bacterium]
MYGTKVGAPKCHERIAKKPWNVKDSKQKSGGLTAAAFSC